MSAERWTLYLRRDAEGAPLVTPLFALEMGPGVHLVDLRDTAAAAGPVGYIPGSVFPEAAALDAQARRSDRLPLVLVSRDGVEAAALARRLEAAGATRVAAMEGRLAAWRAMGFGISRDRTNLFREFTPEPETERGGTAVTLEQLRAALADPRSIHWIQLASLSFHTTQSCVDGRDGRGVVGTPGGDAGEFALLLAAIEQVTGAILSEGMVEEALIAHLDTFGDFYLHTDTGAIERLRTELRADGRTASATPDDSNPDTWRAFLQNAEPGVRDALLEYLVDPAHVGCGHLRLSLEHAEAYGVRRELVASVVRAFFRLLWAGAPELRLVILEGGHAESAVLNIRLTREPWALSQVPIVTPSYGGQQVFVNHPDVMRYWRRAAAVYHVGAPGSLPLTPESGPALVEAIDELAVRQLGETLGHLAKGLPIYDAEFEPDGSVEVMQVGQVG